MLEGRGVQTFKNNRKSLKKEKIQAVCERDI
jgi:hypothetical protein